MIPRWTLDSAYKGFNSAEYKNDKALIQENIKQYAAAAREIPQKGWLKNCIKIENSILDLWEQLASYSYCMFSTDTNDETANKELSAIDEFLIPFNAAKVDFRTNLAKAQSELKDEIAELQEYKLHIEEELDAQKHQMSRELEQLASELSLPGGESWGKLQGAISSNLEKQWSDTENKTVTQLRAMAFDPDRQIRKKAFDLEVDAWKSVEIPLSFALNGVKGFSIILSKHRGYSSVLQKSTKQNRISEKTLEAMISSMEKHLPVFRTYLQKKAEYLGNDKLAFYDIFAPVGKSEKKWTFEQAKNTIINAFTSFNPDLGNFCKKAFDQGWIDAEPRKGKVGGAYCTSLPLSKETRVLANFDGSFDSLTTLAHELGHAYHAEILKDAKGIHRQYPMTLAETASIFAETILFEELVKTAEGDEKLFLIEQYLQGSNQVIVDILSRYYFENTIFEKRAEAELSPREFNEIMVDAQKKTYGEIMDVHHPYMWAVKGHYYSQGLGFYNYPYAFGQLFGLSLYKLYKKQGAEFLPLYDKILEATGQKDAVALIQDLGFSIEDQTFWDAGLEVIAEKVEAFTTLI